MPSPRTPKSAAFALLLATACGTAPAELTALGFAALTPPTRGYTAGSVLWVRAHEDAAIGLVCSPGASLGRDFEPAQDAPPGFLLAAANRTYELGRVGETAAVSELFHGSAMLVTVELSQVTVHSVSDDAIYGRIVERDPVCQRAIDHRRSHGYAITMVAESIEADATYRIHYHPLHMPSRAHRRQTTQLLAHALLLQDAEIGEDTVTARKLTWGIADDALLGTITQDSIPHIHHAPVRVVVGIARHGGHGPDVP